MKAIDIIIGVGWILFWAYWLVMAATPRLGGPGGHSSPGSGW